MHVQRNRRCASRFCSRRRWATSPLCSLDSIYFSLMLTMLKHSTDNCQSRSYAVIAEFVLFALQIAREKGSLKRLADFVPHLPTSLSLRGFCYYSRGFRTNNLERNQRTLDCNHRVNSQFTDRYHILRGIQEESCIQRQ